ncbi:hypothetical protein [Clostridium septicum]|uniref:Uncharacterized protein n=1 Tax=Clostridium septicum TaxID=1504 RepID=A0A9N7JNA2_CLOSE|nr:hypothetical protein [Clostridium septicum]AYE35094.1 hypothetical protein CP523_12080 [Clostridium septicum]MDU1312684.1 hypothetical protein [Clostridium septicum]QAS60487.1 hypothetical protein EI377_06910 [Clostridium septicum]UEC20256.1 hypothetical protein LK444_12730 [Clostridium septicum]USS01691.1 hypothetical protein NH397_04455 [Clostridium septicum]
MLKLSPIELFFRAIPEGFLFILAIYSFSRIKINKKRYVLSSFLYSILVFLVRFLPITYGGHIVINIGIAILIGHLINKIDMLDIIKSVIGIFIIQFSSEGVNLLIIQTFAKSNIEKIVSDPVLKTIYGIPSLVIVAVVITIYYLLMNNKGKLKNV